MRPEEIYWQFYRQRDLHPNNPAFMAQCDLWVAFFEDRPIGAFSRCGDKTDQWALYWFPEKKPYQLLDANLTIVECKKELIKWRLK